MTVEPMSHKSQYAAIPDRDAEPVENRQDRPGANEFLADRSRAVRHHQERLLRIHSPETLEETQLVERLAIAQSKLEEAQAAWDERIRWQMTHAIELHDRGQLEQFRADSKAWREDPGAMCLIFGRTWYSAAFLRESWFEAEMALESEIEVPFQLIKDLILSQFGSWRVDRIDSLGASIIGWFAALQPDSERFAERWVAESRAGRKDVGDLSEDLTRARAILSAAPPHAEARRELMELVERQSRTWSEQAEMLFEEYVVEQGRYTATPPPHPLGTRDDIRETRWMRRELTVAESRFAALERRLLSSIRQRRRQEQDRSRRSPSMSGPESRMSATSREPGKHESPGQKSGSAGQETLRACAMDGATDAPGSTNVATDREFSDADRESGVSDHGARRPDPGSIAKRWRANHGSYRSRSKNRSNRSSC